MLEVNEGAYKSKASLTTWIRDRFGYSLEVEKQPGDLYSIYLCYEDERHRDHLTQLDTDDIQELINRLQYLVSHNVSISKVQSDNKTFYRENN